jgi:oxygen-independent coproporphyrinogen-3 oxidase
MCYDRLIFTEFDSAHQIDFRSYFSKELERLEPLANDDLIGISNEQITITPKGRLLLRSIAMVFDRHLSRVENDGRFSKAI